jgi:hypothetical protein
LVRLSELQEPRGFEAEGGQVEKFHLVVNGSCRLELDGHGPVPLAAGDLVLLSHDGAHTVRNQPGSPVRSLDQILADNPSGEDGKPTYGGHGATTRLLCGGFGLAEPLPDPDRTLLARLLLFGAITAGPAARLTPVLTLLQQEAY